MKINLTGLGLGFIMGGILQLTILSPLHSYLPYLWLCLGAILIFADRLMQKPVDPNAPLCPRCAARMKENPQVQKAVIMTYFIKSGRKVFSCPGCGVEIKLMYRKVDGR